MCCLNDQEYDAIYGALEKEETGSLQVAIDKYNQLTDAKTKGRYAHAISWAYAAGLDTAVDMTKWKEWQDKGVACKYPLSLFIESENYRLAEEGYPLDMQRAFDYCEQCIQNGGLDSSMIFRYGVYLIEGKYCKQDIRRGFEHVMYSAACQDENALEFLKALDVEGLDYSKALGLTDAMRPF